MSEGNTQPEPVELSVIIVVSDAGDRPGFSEVFRNYDRQLSHIGVPYEIIIVLARQADDIDFEGLDVHSEHAEVTVFELSAMMGESAALAVGIKEASGSKLLTLPGRIQIPNEELPRVIEALGSDDMIIVRRWPRIDGWLNRMQTRVFHLVLRTMLKKFSFHDLGCSVRCFRRSVAEHVHLYGDQQRFLPILAARSGFRVREIEIPQAVVESERARNSFGVYLRRLLDLLTIFFLVKFTQKPLRFFGLTGFVSFMGGAILAAYLAYERIYLGESLADRPILLLGLLFIVLGIQFFAFGLIGELVIFLHSKELKAYSVEKVVDSPVAEEAV